jgi:predicted nucleic acid-binding protein
MNIYIETNFVLELALVQEQHESCERLLVLCEAGRASLVLPAFCIAESYEKLTRQAKKRLNMAEELKPELMQLGRSEPYKDAISASERIVGLLVRSIAEEDRRLMQVLDRIFRIAAIVPLEADTILQAAACRAQNKSLSPQDSIVYSSVLHHLESAEGSDGCFISRDRKGFDDPDIVEGLKTRRCKMLFTFIDGYNCVEHVVNAQSRN